MRNCSLQLFRELTKLFTGWAKKVGPQTHGHDSVKSQSIFTFFSGKFLGKFTVRWLLQIPPYLAFVATLPRETMSENKRLTINYKVL